MNIEDDAPRNPRAGKPGTGEVYSWFLNSERVKDYVSDEAIAAARKVDHDLPEARDIVQTCRIFVRRAVRWMTNNGIDQFIDLGSGLPTDNNTHEVAHDIDPSVRVVYVDNDAKTAEQATRMAENIPNVDFIDTDICLRDDLWTKIRATGLIDFERPIGLLMASVIHLITEVECKQAAGISTHQLVRDYVSSLPTGSYLAFAHVTNEGVDMDRLNRVLEYIHAAPRSNDEIRSYFDGTTLVSPYRYEDREPPYDIVRSSNWQASRPDEASQSSAWIQAGVGRVN